MYKLIISQLFYLKKFKNHRMNYSTNLLAYSKSDWVALLVADPSVLEPILDPPLQM